MAKNVEVIREILNREYGVGILSAPPYAIIWAAEDIKDSVLAKQQFNAANKLRENHGICCLYAPYGSRLF